MNGEIIYNHHMFYRDKFYEYKRFCERIAKIKSNCHPPPPTDYPFLRHRMKKHQMEKERQENIEYNKKLLIKKYKSMYKRHNDYHPSNLKFQPLPPSLKFSSGTQYYYELLNQNYYLGNKIKAIQRRTGSYNSDKNLKEYKKMKELGDKIASRSKYKNKLVDLISPLAYEKRLNKMIEERFNKKRVSTPSIYRSRKVERDKWGFCGTQNNFYSNKNRINSLNNINDTNEQNFYKTIEEKYNTNTD